MSDESGWVGSASQPYAASAYERISPTATGNERDELLNTILGGAGVSRDQWNQQLASRGLNDPYAFLGQGVEAERGGLGRITQGTGTARNEMAPYLGMLEAAGIDWRSNPAIANAYNTAQQQAVQQAEGINKVNSQGITLGDILTAAASVWGGGYLGGTGLGALQGLGSYGTLLANPALTGVNLGGAGAGAGAGAAGAGAADAAWGVNLRPDTLQALGTGGAIDMGGSGLTAAEWAAAQQAPFAGMGGSVGAGQLGSGGLGLGSFGGGGFGVGGNTAVEAGFNAGGAVNPTGSFGGGAQTAPMPQQQGFSGTPGGGGGQWPGATQPGVGPGASQAMGLPPGATAPAAVGSQVGGGAAGGDFVSGILEQFKKNALSLGMMGLSLLGAGSAAGKEPEAVKQLGQNANAASQMGMEYLQAAREGRLTGPQQASLDQYKQNAKNQVRQYFASIGQFDSTSRIQAEAQIDQAAVAMQQQLIQETLNSGLSLMGASNTPLAQVAQYQAGQDQALINAMGSFAQGIGSLFGQQAGKGQISQPGQQQQRPPAQQSPAIAQPQTQVQPQVQQEPYYEPVAP